MNHLYRHLVQNHTTSSTGCRLLIATLFAVLISAISNLGVTSTAQATSTPANIAMTAEDLERINNVHYQKVYIGVYLSDISNFDLDTGRFNADMYVWARWAGTAEIPNFHFINAEIDSQKQITQENDGDWHSVRWRIQGTFRGTFPLQNFPFDQQTLHVQIGMAEHQGQLIADLASSGMNDAFSVTGWLYDPFFAADATVETFASDFGSITQAGQPLKLAVQSFKVTLKRPMFAYIIKFILPLIIVVGIAIVSFFLPVGELEARAGLIVTALLSAIAMNFALADSIPDAPYLVLADKFFIVSYIFILLALVETVIVHRWGMGGKNGTRKGIRLDRWSAIISVPFLLIGGTIMIWIALPTDKDHPIQAMGYPAALVSQNQQPPIDAQQTELRIRGKVRTLNSYNITQLYQRGLFQRGADDYRPFQARMLPAMDNQLVQLTPDGGMTVKWQLRPNMLWGDGQPVTPDDVIFTTEYLDDPNMAWIKPWGDDGVAIHFYTRQRYTLTWPNELLPASLRTIYNQPAQPDQSGEAAVDTALYKSLPPALDGPYQVQAFEPKKQVTLKRNPHYAGPRPHLDTITFIAPERGEDAVQALLDRKYHINPGFGPITESNMRAAGLVTGVRSRRLYFLQPDISQPPLDDHIVRQAVMHALNREALAAFTNNDTGEVIHNEVAHSYRSETDSDYATDVTRYTHNPQKARQLLLDAGYTLPIELTLFGISKSPDSQSVGGHIARESMHTLAEAGFKVQYQPVTSGLTALRSGTHGGLLIYSNSQGQEADPKYFWNTPDFDMEKPDRLYDETAYKTYQRYRTNLFTERKNLLSQQLQRQALEQLTIMPIMHMPMYYAHVPELQNYQPALNNLFWDIEQVYLSASE